MEVVIIYDKPAAVLVFPSPPCFSCKLSCKQEVDFIPRRESEFQVKYVLKSYKIIITFIPREEREMSSPLLVGGSHATTTGPANCSENQLLAHVTFDSGQAFLSFISIRLDLQSANPYSQEHRLSQTVQGLLHKNMASPGAAFEEQETNS